MKKDFISMFDLTKQEILGIIDLAGQVKAKLKKNILEKPLSDKTLAMIFEKPSLRTRVTFETGMTQLGGHAIYLAPRDIQLGKREAIPDAAKNLSLWVNIIMARVFAHKTVEDLAKNATIPVINGLCDLEHPCQIMSDLMTIFEKKGSLDNNTIAYIGDGNNVCNSLIAASALLEFQLLIATPEKYTPDKAYLNKASETKLMHDPKQAVENADIIYTDVWASMGQEKEAEERQKIFRPFQINTSLLHGAKKDYRIMHCLPAHRGEEITDEVIDGPASIVLDQAENRLHMQKALIIWLLENHDE